MFKSLALLLAVGLGVWLAREFGLERYLDSAWIDAEVRGKGLAGALIYLGVTWAATSAGLPRQVFAFFGGYAFGFLWGTALSTLGAGLGCLTTLAMARVLGRETVHRLFGKRLAKVDSFLRYRPFVTTLMIRFMPLGSNLLTNLAAGVMAIPVAPFFLGTVLGYIPQNAASALFGSGVSVSSDVKIVMGVALFLVSGLMGVCVYRRHRRR